MLSVLSRIEDSFLSIDEAPHIIRYHTSWEEDDYFFIQLEYAFYGTVAKYREQVRDMKV